MDFQKDILNDLESLQNVDLEEELSIEKIKKFEQQIKSSNQKYMKAFEEQMQQHQVAMEKMNALTTRFINTSMSSIKLPDVK